MAQLKNTHVFTFCDEVNNGALVTVGNNRLARTERETLPNGDEVRRVRCYLHGHNVATFSQTWYKAPGGFDHDPRAVDVELDACGYLTTTTRAAMNDFIGAMRVSGSASVARQELSARYMGLDAQYHDIGDKQGATSLFFVAARRAR